MSSDVDVSGSEGLDGGGGNGVGSQPHLGRAGLSSGFAEGRSLVGRAGSLRLPGT